MNGQEHRCRNIFFIVILTILIMTLVLAFAFEVYTVIVKDEGDSPVPPLFGNFPASRATLEKQQEKGDFEFAAVGDVSSIGTFERIVSELRQEPLDFVFLLGDLSHEGTEEQHRYLRGELDEYLLPCPVFYVVGNHDISPKKFPLERFEKIYGPSIFSFEYRKCLFIVLRILDVPHFNNKESLAFLAKFRKLNLKKYLHTFVFFHLPPSSISLYFRGHAFAEEKELLKLIDKLGIEYVFVGDFHGFGQCTRNNTTYIVTGGGGSALRQKPYGQFYHATILHVTPNSVDMRILSVPHIDDFEDYLEKTAITSIWPWIKRNAALAVALNLIGFITFAFLLYLLIIHMKRRHALKRPPELK